MQHLVRTCIAKEEEISKKTEKGKRKNKGRSTADHRASEQQTLLGMGPRVVGVSQEGQKKGDTAHIVKSGRRTAFLRASICKLADVTGDHRVFLFSSPLSSNSHLLLFLPTHPF